MKKAGPEAIKKIIYLFPLAASLITICLRLISPNFYFVIIQEDGFFEYMQAALYIAASITSLITAINFYNRGQNLRFLICLFFFMLLLFVAGEEISWGQRIFGFQNPDFFNEHNTQQEVSLHNLQPIQNILISSYIIVGFYGSFAWLGLRKIRKIMNEKSYAITKLFVPASYVSSFFYPTLIIYALFTTAARERFLLDRDQEPVELLLSLGIFLMMMINHKTSLYKTQTRSRENHSY